MNTGAPWPDLVEAEARVLKVQTKLHQWAADDPNRRFDDLYNLVYDPAFLEPLVPVSFKITIADGEKKTQDLRLGGGGY